MGSLGTNGDGRYRVLDEGLVVRGIVRIAWPLEASHDPDWAARQAADTLDRLIRRGLPFCRRGGARAFDFCEVVNILKVEGLAGREPTYLGQNLPTWRRTTSESMRIAAPPSGPVAHDPGHFVVSYRREFYLEGCPPGTPVRLRLPLPYDDPTVSDLTVDVLETTTPGVQAVRRPGRLDVRMPAPGDSAPVVVEVRMTFTAWQQTFNLDREGAGPAALDGAEAELYTRRHEGLIRVTAAVSDLAGSLTGPGDDPRTILNAFWAFFFDRMTAGSIHHDELDRDDPLGSLVRHGWFDCYAGSALLVGLCRARGIPARLVNGIMLHDPTPCFHYWAEVFMPTHGWVPVDLASWELAAGDLDLEPWGRLFLGRMGYRLKCQCFPHLVVGPVGVRFPDAWYMLMTLAGGGTETCFFALASPRPILRDVLRLSRR